MNGNGEIVIGDGKYCIAANVDSGVFDWLGAGAGLQASADMLLELNNWRAGQIICRSKLEISNILELGRGQLQNAGLRQLGEM